MKRLPIMICIFLLALRADAQNYKNNIWCFGDSVQMRFGSNNSLTLSVSNLNTRGSSNSISDSSGNLILFSDAHDAHLEGNGGNRTTIWNNQGLPIEQGDSLKGGQWYEDMILIPRPLHPNQYYCITAFGIQPYGIYWNLVDMSLNGGLGKNIQRNVRYDSLAIFDGISAIKHGNGRDWWTIYKDFDPTTITNPNNDFYLVLIDSSGLSSKIQLNVGPKSGSNLSSISFSSKGDFFIWSDLTGIITMFDFDRCTGIISNPLSIDTDRVVGPYPEYISVALSPNDRYLYASSYNEVNNDTNYIFQFDLQAPNIYASKVLVGVFPVPEGAGKIKLAPDNKIYIASWYECPWGYCFPYPDSIHNYISDNLSVINQPDTPGVACDLQKFSVYLGGRRTYSCLPNNPNYALGPLVGSGCDTLSTGIAQVQEPQPQLYVTFESNWKKIFVNAQRLKGRQCRLSVYDVNGKLIDGDRQESYQGYYTKSMEMGGREAGVYLLRLETEKEVLTTKFVIP